MFSLSRALPTLRAACGASTATPRLAPCARAFSTKRAKPMKVKKSEARRAVPEKPKPSDALTELPPLPPPPPPTNPFLNNQTPPPQSFGGAMKESFLWGIGMALAFTLVGVIFMEETSAPGAFEESVVLPADQVPEKEA